MIYFIEVILALSIVYDFIFLWQPVVRVGVHYPVQRGTPGTTESGHLATLRCYLNAISLIVNSTVNGKCLQRSYYNF